VGGGREGGWRKTKPPRRRLLPPSGRGDGLRWSASILHLLLFLLLHLLLLLFRRRCSPSPSSSLRATSYLLCRLLRVYRTALANLELGGGGDVPSRMVRAAIITDVANLGTARISGILSQWERRSNDIPSRVPWPIVWERWYNLHRV